MVITIPVRVIGIVISPVIIISGIIIERPPTERGVAPVPGIVEGILPVVPGRVIVPVWRVPERIEIDVSRP
jgi:hypothetical protein